MKKILCLIDALTLGGAERQMIGLACFLKQKNFQVDLVTYHNQGFYQDLARKYGVQIITLPVKPNKLSKLLNIANHISKSNGYDWVIAYKDGPCLIGCLLKAFGGRFNLIVSERTTNLFCSFSDRIKFFLYRFANYIVPNSYSQEYFIKSHFPSISQKVVTITNFADVDYFVPLQKSNDKQIVITTAARISEAKNIIRYLTAIAQLKVDGITNVVFKWYGDIQSGEESYAELVQANIKKLNLADIVHFYPATKDIVRCYQEADIFCLPSIFEGFPNVVCEAMSCGKPILCSRVCDHPYIVQENVNGILFDPYDTNDIYSALKRMIELPQSKIEEFSQESRKIAETLFSQETFVMKYIELIESM